MKSADPRETFAALEEEIRPLSCRASALAVTDNTTPKSVLALIRLRNVNQR